MAESVGIKHVKSSQEVVEVIPSLPILVFVEKAERKISEGPETPHFPVKDTFIESFIAFLQELEGSNIVTIVDYIGKPKAVFGLSRCINKNQITTWKIKDLQVHTSHMQTIQPEFPEK